MSNFLTYSELIKIRSFEERFEYCRITSQVGQQTFGFDRYLNQVFYQRNPRWQQLRRDLIIRDNGCDLAWEEFPINKRIIIHHLNPITERDILDESPAIFDPENLICVSHNTHNAIHYGTADLLPKREVSRAPNDTCPWRHQMNY